MAGMIPKKKTIQEIDQAYEKLQARHNQLVESWLKARFEPVDSNEKDSKAAACSDFSAYYLI